MSAAAGALIGGRYEILDRIADGGMSTVYRARRQSDGQVVALKILRDQYAADPGFVERFVREARAAEALRHPNIVQVYESGRDGDRYFIAMEYVEGPDLKGYLRRLGRLEAADAERIGGAVCEALEYAHREGIIHRDVKPQNILLAPDGTVKVADFGIARALAAVTITQPGTVLGTVQYLSPEQARGAAVGRPSDLYALGVVLYEMLTGRLPFDGDTPIAIALQHLHTPPPRARAVAPHVPVRLEGIILKAMRKQPGERYASAREMASDLTGETEGWSAALAADEAATRAFEVPDARGPARRGRRTAATVAVVLLALLGGGAWYAWQAASNYLNVPEVEMPSLVGKTLPQAELLVRQAGLVLDVAERAHSATVPPDVIVSQDQPAGKRLKRDRRVSVVVSLGARLAAVPDVVQRTVQEAQLAIDSASLRVGTLQEAYDELVRPGRVIRQDPAAGATVPVDTAVTLVISRGPALVEMPDLIGLTLGEARRRLEERGLVITHLTAVGTTEVEPGTVIQQSPARLARVRPGEVVITVTVSARPGEEAAPPSAPVVTAEPQPVETPGPRITPAPGPTPRPTPTVRPTPTPRPGTSPAAQAPPRPAPTPTPSPETGQVRRTRVQVVVPEGGLQEVKIVVIDETGVRTAYQSSHAPGDRIEQTVRSQGYTIIQVYLGNRLVQEIRP